MVIGFVQLDENDVIIGFSNEETPYCPVRIDNLDELSEWFHKGYSGLFVQDGKAVLVKNEKDCELDSEIENAISREEKLESLLNGTSPDELSDAIVELGEMAAVAEVTTEELMDAVAELGCIVAELLEVLE